MHKMKYSIKYWLGMLVLIMLQSCFEVSEDSLYEDYDPKLVIEGIVTSEHPPYFIKVSKSAPPDDTVDFFPVNNARIIINDNLDEEELARWVSPGLYEVGSFTGKPGAEYHMLVTVDNNDFIATEVMHQVPKVDSISIDYRQNYVDGDGYYFKLFINKQGLATNYYKVEVTKNDSLYNAYSDLLIFDDAYAEQQYSYVLPYSFNNGDLVSIRLIAISEDIYTYYYGLTRQTTNIFSNIQPPFLNPESNIKYGVLGYFQASAVLQVDTILSLP